MPDIDTFKADGYLKQAAPHAADEHRGTTPRFMAQSPVVLTSPLTPASSSPLACVWED